MSGWRILPGSLDKTENELKSMAYCKVISQQQHEGTEGRWPPKSLVSLSVPSTDNPAPSYCIVLKSIQSIATSYYSMLCAIVGCMM